MKKPLLNQLTKKINLSLIGISLLGVGMVPWTASAARADRTVSLVPASLKRVNITGTIKDSKGVPLPGVSVKVKGSTTATTTDLNGVYRINVPEGEVTLVFTFIGYTKQELKLRGGQTTLNVVLQESATDLEEAVVVGYGAQKKAALVGAVATLRAEEIEDIPSPNIAGALRNRIAGVGVSAASGRPGASIVLNVRSSRTSDQAALYGVSAEPLYIIDNITVDRETFDTIDPSMIESMSILKDASAAIYGAAGAKGVILITTKKGKMGKPSISYTGYGGVSDIATRPDMLNAYEHATLLNDGYYATPGVQANKFFADSDLVKLQNNTIKPWFDEIWKASATQRHNLSISGGTEKLTFFAGGSMQDNNGNYAGLNVQKFSFRTGMTASVNEQLKAEVNFNVDYNKKSSSNGLSENDQNFYQSLITTPQWVPIEINGMPVNFSNINANSNFNPVGQINSGYYDNTKSRGYRINASLSYQPKFLKGLTARFQVSQAGNNSEGTSYRPSYLTYNFVRTGNNSLLFTDRLILGNETSTPVSQANTQLTPTLGNTSSYQGFLTLQYQASIRKHTFSIMAGGEQSGSYGQNLSVYWRNQMLLGVEEHWAFDPNTITLRQRQQTEGKKRSAFGRLNYNYANKYMLESVVRLDASSNFATGNIWGVFPSVGLGWIASEEGFFKDNINFISYLKLRLNYGLVGDDRVTARLWQDRYTVDPNGYSYADNLQAGLNPTLIANPNITWEKARTLNFGFESNWFNDKISLNIDLFKRWSSDMFDRGADQTFPMYAGFNAPVLNYQERESWGSEFSIGYKTRIAKEVGFNAAVNFGYGNSRVTRMLYNRFQLFENSYPDWKVEFGTDPRTYNTGNYGLIVEGMFRSQAEVDEFLAQNPNYTIDAKIPQAGWLYFKDSNGDGRITERDMVPMYKNSNAIIGLGMTFGFTYKSLSLNTNLVANLGGREFVDSYARKGATDLINVPSFWRDHWSLDNPNGTFPKFDDASISRGWQSTFWKRDGTMIRVNNMTLSYKLADKFAKSVGISNARIILTGNNLWTLVNPFKYKDPYSSYVYDYPTLRTISVGLSVGL